MLEGIIRSFKESKKEIRGIELAEHPDWTENDWDFDSWQNNFVEITFGTVITPATAVLTSTSYLQGDIPSGNFWGLVTLGLTCAIWYAYRKIRNNSYCKESKLF